MLFLHVFRNDLPNHVLCAVSISLSEPKGKHRGVVRDVNGRRGDCRLVELDPRLLLGRMRGPRALGSGHRHAGIARVCAWLLVLE